MLQQYLNSSLLPITEDANFDKLKKSADDIAKKMVKSKAKIVSYTLSAIDTDISVDNADIVEVKNVIVKNWNTFTTNAKDTPLTYIRAVMLEALSSISDDVNHSLIIWLSSRNIVQYQKLIGKEKEIILSFLSKLGNDINQKANQEWALSSNESLSKIDIELKDVTTYLINNDTLKKYLQDASGPSNSDGEANFESPNQYWSNQAQHWSYQFAPRATKGIKNVVDTSLKAIVTVVNDNKDMIQKSLNKAFEQVQKEASNRSKSLQLRSELLWWKEAGYSSSTDKSYNELNESILGVVLANDYSSFISAIYPKSVDYFLKETYKGIKGNTTEEITFEDFLKTIQEHTDELKPIFSETEALTGKSTLLNFINGLIWKKHQLAQFEELLGIPLNIKLPAQELTTWLFHDFQLIKVLNSK